MLQVDLEPLQYCRDARCERIDLHPAHGHRRGAVRVDKCPPPAPITTRRDVEVGQGLIEITLRHVGVYVPVQFADLYSWVINDYGPVTDRSVHRAIAALIDDRLVASLGSASWDRRAQRSMQSPGWYLRYDSPKLWSPGGLRDLMNVVADHAAADNQPRRRPTGTRPPVSVSSITPSEALSVTSPHAARNSCDPCASIAGSDLRAFAP